MAALAHPDFEDRGVGVYDAADCLDRIVRRRRLPFEVLEDRPSAGKQPYRPALQPWFGEFERLRQGGEGARGDAVHSSDVAAGASDSIRTG